MRMGRCFPGPVFAALTLAFPLLAAEQGAWLDERQTLFAQWQATNPDIQQQVSELKTLTAALVSQHRARQQAEAEERRAQLISHSRTLPAQAQQQIRDLMQQASDHLSSGNCERAMPLFRRTIEIDPARASASLGIGRCLRRQGDSNGASEYLTRAVTMAALTPEGEAAGTSAMMALQALPPPPDPDVDQPPVIFRAPDAPAEVWDAPEAPVMTVIPAGEFTMGAPATEQYFQAWETQHRVTISYPLAVSKYNVTRGEYAAFVAATGYDSYVGRGCNVYDSGFSGDANADWRTPGFVQSDEHPVVCVSYDDAVAYADWLTQTTGHKYRLPSEAEWEYATRAGTTTIYYWGTEIGDGNANCDGCNGPSSLQRTTPGGAYPPNAFGLYDMVGNVWKWLADCWNNTYAGAPTDGSAWTTGNCALRGRRTGAWFNVSEPRPNDFRAPGRLRSAGRFGSIPGLRYSTFGMRVVREL